MPAKKPELTYELWAHAPDFDPWGPVGLEALAESRRHQFRDARDQRLRIGSLGTKLQFAPQTTPRVINSRMLLPLTSRPP